MYEPLPESLNEYIPNDKDIIWKYMSLDNFIYLLEYNCLYLPRADSNPIYFEGHFFKSDIYYLTNAYRKDGGFEKPIDAAKEVFKHLEKYKSCTYLDCWHKNSDENFAMWKIYGKTDNSIAIKTSVKKLKNIYNNKEKSDCYLAEVLYYNFDDYNISKLTNIDLLPFIRKPDFFYYEEEIRGIIQWGGMPGVEYPLFETIPFTKRSEHFELSDFVDEIVICPYSSDWLLKLIEKLLREKGIKKIKISNSKYRK